MIFVAAEFKKQCELCKFRINWSTAKKNTSVFGKVAITGKLSVKRADFEKELILAGFNPADMK